MLSLARHSRNGLNTSWQCFRGSAELTSHLTQRSVSYSRRNCSYNIESAKQCDHWPREVECSKGLTDTGTHVHKGASLGCVHTKRGSQLETLKTHYRQHNGRKRREHPVVLRHWRRVHIPQVVTVYCTDLILLRAGRKVYCGHGHGQRRYWRSLAPKVSSGWCLADHRQGQKHTNLDVISPIPSSAPAHVQVTTAYGRMKLHFHLNLRTK